MVININTTRTKCMLVVCELISDYLPLLSVLMDNLIMI